MMDPWVGKIPDKTMKQELVEQAFRMGMVDILYLP